jgi:hypothetical protein
MLTGMDSLQRARDELNAQLRAAIQTDQIKALQAIGQVDHDLAEHKRDAVRQAAAEHTWAEIGEALGVSRQAVHRFAKDWGLSLRHQLKAEHRAQKEALARGDRAAAARASERRDALIDEIKRGGRTKDR